MNILTDKLMQTVGNLNGVGEKGLEILTRLGCKKIIDLIFHFPHYIEKKLLNPPLYSLQDGSTIIVQLIVEHIDKNVYAKNKFNKLKPFKIICANKTGYLDLIFFNYFPHYIIDKLKVGDNITVSGKVVRFNGKLQISHPDYIILPQQINNISPLNIIYPLTYALTQKQLTKYIHQALAYLPDLPEWIDNKILIKKSWLSWKESIIKSHTLSLDYLDRLAFDEILAQQLALKMVRQHKFKSTNYTINHQKTLKNKLLNYIGFELTEAQKQVIADIEQDQYSINQMHRLIQGDVGSGKTIIALCAMLNTIEAEKQATIMAPTDILAAQHYEWIKKVTTELNINIALLTGKIKGKKRIKILEEVKDGTVDLLIGTHAIFQDIVAFKELGIVVIDEQHRFGVEQRLKLAAKGNKTDILIMTATPIPRTLLMAIYSDMDTSYLTDKPKGRLPIITTSLSINKISSLITSLKTLLINQARSKIYWICPLVEDTEDTEDKENKQTYDDLTAAVTRYNELNNIFPHKVELIHGQMKSLEKETAMQKFADPNSEVAILVATTVIEVGINVPEANIIIIEHAERFGLAQLHQLRGRVGRNDKQSYCLLLYGNKLSDIAKSRINTMVETNDGFIIAEQDLKLRGAGEILGTRQSGMPDFKILNLEKHLELINLAANYAKEISEQDPYLQTESGKRLRILLNIFKYDKLINYIKAI